MSKINTLLRPASLLALMSLVAPSAAHADIPLPEGYTALEYIESTGTQCIDTGYACKKDDEVNLEMYLPKLQPDDANYRCVFGVRNANAWYRIDTRTGAFRYMRASDKSVSSSNAAFYDGRVKVICNKTGMQISDGGDPIGWGLSSVGDQALSLAIFGEHRDDLGDVHYDQFAAMKLYSFRIVSGGVVKRDFIPCLNDEGEAGLWDRVEGAFHGNVGTGSFFYGGIDLPEGYKALEYIESTGTQCIDTGYVCKKDDEVNLEMYLPKLQPDDTVYGCVFGVRNANAWYRIDTRKGTFRYMRASNKASSSTNAAFYDGRVKVVCNKTGMQICNGGTPLSWGIASVGDQALSLAVFGEHRDDLENVHYDQFVAMKLYSFRIVSDGVVKRDFIPCLNDEGEVGLWDRVEGAFYGNVGTGSFIHSGIDLPEDYTALEYIESTGTQCIDTEYVCKKDDEIDFEMQFPIMQSAEMLSGNVFGQVCAIGVRNTNAWYRIDTRNGTFRYMRAADKFVSSTNAAFYAGRIKVVCNKTGMQISDGGAPIGWGLASVGDQALSLAIFGEHRDDLGDVHYDQFAAMKLYSFRIVSGGVVKRDFMPCLNDEGEAGLWDRVGGAFHGNVGTGEFYAGGKPLPGNCCALDYIESTGTQCIDTGYVCKKDDEVDLEMYLPKVQPDDANYRCVFGVRNADAWYRIDTRSGTVRYMRASNKAASSQNAAFYDGRIKVVCAKFGMRISDGGAPLNWGLESVGDQALSLAVFGEHRDDLGNVHYDQFAAMKLYSFRIVSGGVVKRDFVPCALDGEVGLWDRAEGRFYGNCGTGSFGCSALKSEAEGVVLKIYEGVMAPSDVAGYESIVKTQKGVVVAGSVTSYPGALTIEEGCLNLADGVTRSHSVSGVLTPNGGACIRIDVNRRSCDSLAVGDLDLSNASASNPIVLSVKLAEGSQLSKGRVYKVIGGAAFSEEDAEKFGLEGLDNAVVKVVDGDLCIVDKLWPSGFMFIIR